MWVMGDSWKVLGRDREVYVKGRSAERFSKRLSCVLSVRYMILCWIPCRSVERRRREDHMERLAVDHDAAELAQIDIGRDFIVLTANISFQ